MLVAPLGQLNILKMFCSNYENDRGGIWDHIKIGDAKTIQKSREGKIAKDLFLFGSFFIIGVYYFFFYLQRKEEKASLYLSILCFLFSFRILFYDGMYISTLIPWISWNVHVKIGLASYYLTISIAANMAYLLYPQKIFKKCLIILNTFGVLALLSVIFLPYRVSTALLVPSYYMLALLSVFALYSMIKASIMKKRGSIVTLTGFSIFCITVFSLISFSSFKK